jgi:hypothetical protein
VKSRTERSFRSSCTQAKAPNTADQSRCDPTPRGLAIECSRSIAGRAQANPCVVPEMEIELKLCFPSPKQCIDHESSSDFLTFSYSRPILFSGTAAAPMDKKKFCSYPSLMLSSGSLEADIVVQYCSCIPRMGARSHTRDLGVFYLWKSLGLIMLVLPLA